MLLGFAEEPRISSFRTVVLELYDSEGTVIGRAASALQDRCPVKRKARWVRLGEPLREPDAARFRARLRPHLQRVPRVGQQAANGGGFELVAAVFPEEHEWRDGGKGLGWVSVLSWRREQRRKKRRRGVNVGATAFVRTSRGGPGDYRTRVPEAAFLQDKKVALVGVGCIGAPIAMELAQLGVGRLHLVDHDYVEPAATVRWPLGLSAYGLPKVEALRDFILGNFPFTDVSGSTLQIGAIRRGETNRDLKALADIHEGTSIILDASAEHGVQRFLSELARHHNIPYVWVSGTWGGWGGFVGVATRYDEACWACIEAAVHDGEIPAPHENPNGAFQPAGCGDITFTGLGVDMHLLSLGAARTCIAVLSPGESSYPRGTWNAQVINLRSVSGDLVPPAWNVYSVAKRSDCRVCGSA